MLKFLGKNKQKQELVNEAKRMAYINKQKDLARKIFPFIQSQKTVYDAQTALTAVSGYIKEQLTKKIQETKVSDLKVEMANEKQKEIKAAMDGILAAVQDDEAENVEKILLMMSDKLAQYGANKFLKQPMSEVSVKDFIA